MYITQLPPASELCSNHSSSLQVLLAALWSCFRSAMECELGLVRQRSPGQLISHRHQQQWPGKGYRSRASIVVLPMGDHTALCLQFPYILPGKENYLHSFHINDSPSFVDAVLREFPLVSSALNSLRLPDRNFCRPSCYMTAIFIG